MNCLGLLGVTRPKGRFGKMRRTAKFPCGLALTLTAPASAAGCIEQTSASAGLVCSMPTFRLPVGEI